MGHMLISSRANPAVKRIVSLQGKKYRDLYGEYLAEGEKMVSECLSAGQRVKTLVLSERMLKKEESMLSLCRGERPQIVAVTDDVFAKMSGERTPQGVLAVIAKPGTGISAPAGNCLLLDGVSDPGNVGAIIRTANAAGYEDIYLLRCADPYSPKAVRASMSGLFHVRLREGIEEEILSALQGIPLIAAALDGKDLFTFVPPPVFCLVIGNEGHGISDAVRAYVADTVTIPMRATQESLNAAVSAGIAMYVLCSNACRAEKGCSRPQGIQGHI